MGKIIFKFNSSKTGICLLTVPFDIIQNLHHPGLILKSETTLHADAYFDTHSRYFFIKTDCDGNDWVTLEASETARHPATQRSETLNAAVFYDDFETIEGWTIKKISDGASYKVESSVLTLETSFQETGLDIVVYKTGLANILPNTLFAIIRTQKDETIGGGPILFWATGHVGDTVGYGLGIGLTDHDKYGCIDNRICSSNVVQYDLADRADNNAFYVVRATIEDFSSISLEYYQNSKKIASGTLTFACELSLDTTHVAFVNGYAHATFDIEAFWIVDTDLIVTDILINPPHLLDPQTPSCRVR